MLISKVFLKKMIFSKISKFITSKLILTYQQFSYMTLIHIILVNPQKYPCMIGESKILWNSMLINLLINKLFMTLNGLEENLFQIHHIL